MILTILKWIGIGLISWVIFKILINIFLVILYKTNKNYKDYCDKIVSEKLIKEELEEQQIEEQKKNDKMSILVHQWTQVAQYYYYYYEKGVLMPDYAYMLDLLSQQIITMLGGDYQKYRNDITELLKGKDVKDSRRNELEDKGIPPCPKDIKPGDFEKRNYSDDDINKILDEWEKRFKKLKDNETEEDK